MIKRVSMIIVLFAIVFSFNSYAMNNMANRGFERPSPLNESDSSVSKWTWISDESCVRFFPNGKENTAYLIRLYETGMLAQWAEGRENEKTVIKQRDTYSGKWSQSSEGIWSFEFDDKTIPVGVTMIDGVLYAFTGYGELKADYEYYDGLKTGADGLVTADSAEFKDWLATQYLPECTSHE